MTAPTTTRIPARRLQRAGKLFHALSDPTRLQILDCLASGECCVCEMTDALDVAQSRLSFHLKVLKDAGFLRGRREGRWMYYTVDPAAWGRVDAVLGDLKPGPAAQTGEGRCC